MSYDVNPGNVQWVTHRVGQALDGGQFNIAEVMMGLAEVMGRAIVSVSETPVQGVQCAKIMEDHLKRTLVAGFTSKGFNMGGTVLEDN